MSVTLPYTFVNDTVADAAQVNANFAAVGAYVDGKTPWVTPEMFGAVGDASWTLNSGTDDSNAFQATIDYAQSNSTGIILSKKYRITKTLYVSKASNKSAIKIIGARNSALSGDSAVIYYYGTEALFEVGVDSGALYEGEQGFTMQDVYLFNRGNLTPLLNGSTTNNSYYGTGVVGVRDWRGGSCRFIRCIFECFENGFYGKQSDLNYFEGCVFAHNHVGVYLDERSDQAHFSSCWSSSNDTAMLFDGVYNALIDHHTSDGDGTATVGAFDVRASYSRGTSDIHFRDCWFEHYGYASDNQSLIIPSYISIGESNTSYDVKNVTVTNPFIIGRQSYFTPSTPRTDALVSFNRLNYLYVDRPTTRGGTNELEVDYLVLANNDGTNWPVVHINVGTQVPRYIPDGYMYRPNTGVGNAPQSIINSGNSGMTFADNGTAIFNISPNIVPNPKNGSTPGTLNAWIRCFRNTVADSVLFDINDGNVSSSVRHRFDGKGNIIAGYGSAGAYNQGHVQLGNYHLWVDSSGRLRIKSSAPSSDTDGTIVGTQA